MMYREQLSHSISQSRPYGDGILLLGLRFPPADV